MDVNVPSPARGSDILPWAHAVTDVCRRYGGIGSANLLVREGPGGIGYETLPQNKRRTKRDAERPWALSSVSDENGNAHVCIFLPGGSLVYDGEIVSVEDIDGITPVKGNEKHYQLDVADASGDHLVVLQGKKSEEEDEVDFSIALEIPHEDEEQDEDILMSIPIGRIVSDEDKVGKRTVGSIEQLSVGTIVLERGANEPDDISLGHVTADNAKDPKAVQVKDFDNDQSDGKQGLAERLKVVKVGSGENESFKIVAKERSAVIHLLARVNGKIKYIPLTGADDEDEDEKNPVAQDPCGHPGSEGPHGGADPEADRTHGENDEGDFENDGDWPHHGGVSASDDGHEGDPCNCN